MGHRGPFQTALAQLDSKFAVKAKQKENVDVNSDYHSVVVVWRRRRLLRVFEMGHERRPWSRWDGTGYRVNFVSAWVLAVTQFDPHLLSPALADIP
jgi:hypothetical protein